MLNIAVLVSGGGTNLQALLDSEARGENPNGRITLVVASKPGVYALERAAKAGVEGCVVRRKDYASSEDFDAALLKTLKDHNIDLVVLAGFLSFYFNHIFEDVVNVGAAQGETFEQMLRIGPNDVLIAISFPRYSTRTLEAMSFAKARGAQVIGLTDGPMSPVYATSTVCLTARPDMASFVDSMAAPLSVINALIVALGLRRKDELSEHFRLMEGIWDEYRVYVGKDRV